jgi:hypothetical protein
LRHWESYKNISGQSVDRRDLKQLPPNFESNFARIQSVYRGILALEIVMFELQCNSQGKFQREILLNKKGKG